MAERENVACKVSGVSTCCPPGQASVDTLRPWIEHVIAAFGWDRLVFGGDWPVCNMDGNLESWCAVLDEILAAESPSHLEKLYKTNAERIYRL